MVSLVRRLLLVAATVTTDVGAWRGLADDRVLHAGATLPALITVLAAWAVQVGLAWLSVLLVLLVLEPVAGRELTGYAACPPGVRRVLVALCGAVALGAVTGPVHADAPHDQGRPPHTHTARLALDGLALPDRTTDPDVRPATVARSADPGVTVRPGDSLWGIARDELRATHPGRDPSAGEIDRAWRSWYAANRARVGRDPALIVPGTRLHPPAATDPTTDPATDRPTERTEQHR